MFIKAIYIGHEAVHCIYLNREIIWKTGEPASGALLAYLLGYASARMVEPVAISMALDDTGWSGAASAMLAEVQNLQMDLSGRTNFQAGAAAYLAGGVKMLSELLSEGSAAAEVCRAEVAGGNEQTHLILYAAPDSCGLANSGSTLETSYRMSAGHSTSGTEHTAAKIAVALVLSGGAERASTRSHGADVTTGLATQAGITSAKPTPVKILAVTVADVAAVAGGQAAATQDGVATLTDLLTAIAGGKNADTMASAGCFDADIQCVAGADHAEPKLAAGLLDVIGVGNLNSAASLTVETPDSIKAVIGTRCLGQFNPQMQHPTEINAIANADFVGAAGANIIKVFNITFMTWDGSAAIYVEELFEGNDCLDPVKMGLIEQPTRESTAQYDYTYAGWAATVDGDSDNTLLLNVSGSKQVYAAFTPNIRYYTVSYYDGDTLLGTESVAYGSTPQGITPERENYIFAGWDPQIAPVTGEASYRAKWQEDLIASGTCGTSVYWKLRSNGEMIIYGTGEMESYYVGGSILARPWKDYASEIKTVVIEPGVTVISDQSLRGLSNLTSVTIPDTVWRIGISAFLQCTSLPGITIPDSVTTIDSYAFIDCKSLKSITIPASVTTFNTQPFSNCIELESVILMPGLKVIPKWCFNGCAKLTSIIIPSSITRIYPYAFQGSGLTSATFEAPKSWKRYSSETASVGYTITSSYLANATTAGTYLKTTYVTYDWRKY